ncbi:MAG: rhodanese-like domain-containing protein [Clostridia bacterium]
MKEKDFLHICGGFDGRPRLGLSGDGRLWRMQDGGDWEDLKFNKIYSGYYPTCTFTAIGCFEVGFVAAGLGEDGLPLAFHSILGGVWDALDLVESSMIHGYKRATGRINAILYDHRTKQIFLLCGNGEIVTLPDCPKCVRIKKVSEVGIKGGSIEGDRIVLLLENGDKMYLPLQEAVQYRVSFSYAKQLLSSGGYLVDLRDEARRRAEDLVEGSISISMDAIYDWLSGVDKKANIVFFCSYGVQADEIVQYARSHGHPNTYSLGGIHPFFHVE